MISEKIENTPYYIILVGGCIYQEKINGRYYETNNYKCIELPFRFSTEELHEFYDDYDYGHLIHTFNELIQAEYKDYFLRESVIEPVRNLSEKDSLEKYTTIYCIDDYPDRDVMVSFIKPAIKSCR